MIDSLTWLKRVLYHRIRRRITKKCPRYLRQMRRIPLFKIIISQHPPINLCSNMCNKNRNKGSLKTWRLSNHPGFSTDTPITHWWRERILMELYFPKKNYPNWPKDYWVPSALRLNCRAPNTNMKKRISQSPHQEEGKLSHQPELAQPTASNWAPNFQKQLAKRI